MKNCPYLIFKEPTGCVDCSGFRCTAGSREKKLSDVSICQNEEAWRECAKYLSLQPNAAELIISTPIISEWTPLESTTTIVHGNNATPAPVITITATSQTCPYLEPTPGNECCSATCHAKEIRVVPRKNCRSPEQCTRYLAAKLAGKPYRGGG